MFHEDYFNSVPIIKMCQIKKIVCLVVSPLKGTFQKTWAVPLSLFYFNSCKELERTGFYQIQHSKFILKIIFSQACVSVMVH